MKTHEHGIRAAAQVRIEKHIPYPDRRRAGKYPFGDMDVGDSFLATAEEKTVIYYHMKMHGPKRFITRSVSENGQPMMRIWRIL